MGDSSEGLDSVSGLVEVDPTVDSSTPAIRLSPSAPVDDEEDTAPEEVESEGDDDLDSAHDSDSDISIGEGEEEEEAGSQEDVPPSKVEEELRETGEASDTDSDVEMDEERHQKFDPETRAGFLERFHPEAKVASFDEVRARSRITRGAQGYIEDPNHRSIPILTKYELTRVLGLRARQIDEGAAPLVSVPSGVLDGYVIAKAELDQKKIPFIIRRPMPSGESEYWRLQDLEVLRAPAGFGPAPSASISSGSHS